MTRRVAILFANLRGNVGDFALLHATLLDAERFFPGAAYEVFAHNLHSVDEERLAAFRAGCPITFEIVGQTYASPPLSRPLVGALQSLGAWRPVQDAHVRRLAARSAADARKFAAYAAVLFVGGDQWHGDLRGISMFGTLAAVGAVNPNLYAYPFSVTERVRRQNGARALRGYFGMLAHRPIARDGESVIVLDELGIPAVGSADCVFSLQEAADAVPPLAGVDPSRIIISATNTRSDELLEGLARLAPMGRKLALMTTFGEIDAPEYAAAAKRYGLEIITPVTWQETIAHLKASALTITNRLHGLIFAFLAGTPTLPIVNRVKSRAFSADARLPLTVASAQALDPAIVAACEAERERVLAAQASYAAWARASGWSPLAAVNPSVLRDAS